MEDVKGKEYLQLKEQKTDKAKRAKINPALKVELDDYIKDKQDGEYLFTSRKGENKQISRVQAYRILNGAGGKIGLEEIGTHTLRKTYGYHFYQKTKDVAMLQELFNHSSPSITLKYIGINQDMMDKAMDDFSL